MPFVDVAYFRGRMEGFMAGTRSRAMDLTRRRTRCALVWFIGTR